MHNFLFLPTDMHDDSKVKIITIEVKILNAFDVIKKGNR